MVATSPLRSREVSRPSDQDQAGVTIGDLGSVALKKAKESVIGVKRRKETESGIIHSLRGVKVVMFFEQYPIWFLSIDTKMMSEIVVIGFEDWDDFCNHVNRSAVGEFLTKLASLFDHNILKFTPNFPKCDTTYISLISGPVSFLQGTLRTHSLNNFLFVTEEQTRIRKLPTLQVTIHRARH